MPTPQTKPAIQVQTRIHIAQANGLRSDNVLILHARKAA
jgi:hypothetical protein